MTGVKDNLIEEKQVQKGRKHQCQVLFNYNKNVQVQTGLNKLECEQKYFPFFLLFYCKVTFFLHLISYIIYWLCQLGLLKCQLGCH